MNPDLHIPASVSSHPGNLAAQQATAIAPGQVEPPVPMLDDLRIESKRSLTLGCGRSSITLHSNGKIVLHGDYIVSDAGGIQRIVGGQIELN